MVYNLELIAGPSKGMSQYTTTHIIYRIQQNSMTQVSITPNFLSGFSHEIVGDYVEN